MFYKQRRRLYSQNFLRSPELVKKLIRNSSIGKFDTVIEIGPGRGVITKELAEAAGKVVAVELDKKLTLFLQERFWTSNVEIVNADFLNFSSPKFPYKVFANIPFNISADIVRKLVSDNSFSEGYIIVQKEFAKKIIGKPYDYKNTMMATLLKPWFDTTLFYNFSRHDFVPSPYVDCVMIKMTRLQVPLLPFFQKNIFEDFITYSYNRKDISTEDFENVLSLFNKFYLDSSDKEKTKIHIKASEIRIAQKNIQKIHRTRKDKGWRKY